MAAGSRDRATRHPAPLASGALPPVLAAKIKDSYSQAKVAAETIALIRQMATENRLWGAERIRGELLKLGIQVCKRTIQKYMRTVRSHQPRGQKWATFLRNHAGQIWACDFLQVTDLFFRPLFAFFIIELKSRKVIQVGVTRSPTDAWVAQQLREATPYGQAPKYLIRDNDSKFGSCFCRVATTSGIKLLKTPYHAPRANAVCERFLRSVRQECLDHLLILQEKQLQRVLNAYVRYFNRARPHQGIGQQIPEQGRLVPSSQDAGNKVMLFRWWVGCTMITAGQPEAVPRGRAASWWTSSIQLVASCLQWSLTGLSWSVCKPSLKVCFPYTPVFSGP